MFARLHPRDLLSALRRQPSVAALWVTPGTDSWRLADDVQVLPLAALMTALQARS